MLSGWGPLTPHGRDTNPTQVSSQQMLVLIYLPWKDGKLSWLRQKRRLHKYSKLRIELGPCGRKAEISPTASTICALNLTYRKWSNKCLGRLINFSGSAFNRYEAFNREAFISFLWIYCKKKQTCGLYMYSYKLHIVKYVVSEPIDTPLITVMYKQGCVIHKSMTMSSDKTLYINIKLLFLQLKIF